MSRINPHSRPFLVDAHVHVRTREGFRTAADAGVRAIRDAGFASNAQSNSLGPSREGIALCVISSGWALYPAGGYGSAFGVAVASREEIRREIERLATAGAGIIKVMASGMVSFKKPGTITPGGFPPGHLKFIVQVAAARGLPVMAHASGEASIMAAAAAGVTSIEHGFYMTDRALDALARHNTAWVPTITALARAAKSLRSNPELSLFVQDLIRSHQQMILSAHNLHIGLALGTDAVLPCEDYRAAYDDEMSSFREAGLSSSEVIDIATRGGMTLLGLSDSGGNVVS